MGCIINSGVRLRVKALSNHKNRFEMGIETMLFRFLKRYWHTIANGNNEWPK
jgi:hypothetical protein